MVDYFPLPWNLVSALLYCPSAEWTSRRSKVASANVLLRVSGYFYGSGVFLALTFMTMIKYDRRAKHRGGGEFQLKASLTSTAFISFAFRTQVSNRLLYPEKFETTDLYLQSTGFHCTKLCLISRDR